MARGGGRAGRVRRRRRRGHRPLGADARARRARCAGSAAALGDPLERRPHAGAVRARSRSGSGSRRSWALTGNRALAGCTAPSLLWVREHEPELFARVALDPAAEGLRAAAVDAACTRPTPSTPRARCCSTSRGGSGRSRCSPRWSWTRRGCRRCSSRPRCAGVAGRVPVAAGAGDEAAAAVGCGVVSEDDPVSIVVGTSGVVVAALDGYAADPWGRAHAYCHAVPGGWNVLGVTLSAGGSLVWLRDVLDPGASLASLIAEASVWPPGTEGLLFAPQLAGERMPHADPAARGGFVGLATRHDRGALVRAVLEGVAFSLRESLGLLDGLARRPRAARVSRRRRPLRRVAEHPRRGARPAVGGLPRPGGRRLRRRAARRRRRGRLGRRPGSGRACVRSLASSSRAPTGSRATPRSAPPTPRCTRRCTPSSTRRSDARAELCGPTRTTPHSRCAASRPARAPRPPAHLARRALAPPARLAPPHASPARVASAARVAPPPRLARPRVASAARPSCPRVAPSARRAARPRGSPSRARQPAAGQCSTRMPRISTRSSPPPRA